MPPPELAPGLQRLPPMLHSLVQRAMTSYSKGAWGLFVLLRGLGTQEQVQVQVQAEQCAVMRRVLSQSS